MSINQAIMKRSLGLRRERGPAWKRGAMRAAILDAARSLVAREGVERFTLTGVAREANLSPSTVSSYFVREADLIAAVVADDLAAFARGIADGFVFSAPANVAIAEPKAETLAEQCEQSDGSPRELPLSATEAVDPLAGDHAENGAIASDVGEASDAAVTMKTADAQSPPDDDMGDAEPESVSQRSSTEEPVLAQACRQSLEITPEEPLSAAAAVDAPAGDHAANGAIASCVGAASDAAVTTESAHLQPHPDDEIIGGEPENSIQPSPIEQAVPAGLNVEHEPAPSAPVAEAIDCEPGCTGPVDASGAISALEARIAQLEARRVDAWLERRLREFERMLAALDERVAAGERSAISAGAPVESGLQELRQRVENWENQQGATAADQAKSFAEKLESSEARLRQSVSELRSRVLEISSRLDAVERDRELHAIAAEMPVTAVNPYHSQNAIRPAQETPLAPADSAEVPDAADETYLAAARRAALAAQSLAQDEAGEDWRSIVGHRQTRLLLGLCAGLGLVLAGAGVALKHHFASTAIARPAAAGTHSFVPSGLLSDADTQRALAGANGAKAMLGFGLSYLNGVGVAEDDARAAGWIARAALRGEPIAQYWLGTLFEHGRGERVDPVEAFRWYEAAALQGNLRATYKLGVFYAEGWGTQKNYSESARWFSRAAESGFVNAQYNLGVLYERGLGVPQSLLDAYKWYSLAAAQGDKDSASRIDAMSSQMTAEDLTSAREAVAAFKPEVGDVDANATPTMPGMVRIIPADPAPHPKNG